MADTQQTVLAGRYRLVDQLGRGGMGTVWRAHDELLDRDVAVKEVLLPPGVDDETRDDLMERTKREARAAARLSHPNVVTVFDVVEVEGRPWIVMELVRARGLNQIVRDEGPLPPERVAEIGVQLLNALGVAHASGIFHRDVKPSNVLVSDNGRVVLADFGIASVQGDPAMTRSGLILGSPSYIAPERARGLPAEQASDLWAVGATLYTAVEGRPPYDRDGIVPILTAAAMEDPDPFVKAGPIAPVLTALLQREPAKRPSIDEARLALRQISLAALPPAPPERPRRRNLTATAVLPATDPSIDKPVSPAAKPVSPAAAPTSPAAAGAVAGTESADAVAPASPAPAPGSAATPATPAQRTPPDDSPAPVSPAPVSPAAVGFASEPGTKTPRRASLPPDGVSPTAAPAGASSGRGRAIGIGAAILVVLLLVGGLVYGLSNRADDSGDPTPAASSAAPSASTSAAPSTSSAPASSSPSASAPASPSASQPADSGSTAIPAGWRRVSGPGGFTIGVPNGWTASDSGGGYRINGNNGFFLLIQQTDQPKPDAKKDWETQEPARRNKGNGYQRISIEKVQYRDYSTAADWQFLFNRGGQRIHVLNRGFVTSPSKAYSLYFEAPADQWDEGYNTYFTTFANTFQPGN